MNNSKVSIFNFPLSSLNSLLPNFNGICYLSWFFYYRITLNILYLIKGYLLTFCIEDKEINVCTISLTFLFSSCWKSFIYINYSVCFNIFILFFTIILTVILILVVYLNLFNSHIIMLPWFLHFLSVKAQSLAVYSR